MSPSAAADDAQTTTTTTTIQNDANTNMNANNPGPTIIVRDFAYPDGNASISPTPPLPSIVSTVKPPFSTIAESSHSTKTSSTASIQSDDDSNKLPYTHFYDPSWTLSPDELQGKAHEAPVLNASPTPALRATTTTLFYQPVIPQPTGSLHYNNTHQPRQSSNSHTSLTSQYSTYSIYPVQAPIYQRGLGNMGRVPLQTLESGVEFDSNPETGTGEMSSIINPGADLPHARTDSNTTSNTASSKYSEYSTTTRSGW